LGDYRRILNRRFSPVPPQSTKPRELAALPTVELSMKYSRSLSVGAFALAALLAGCDQFGGAKHPLGPPEVPSDAQLKKISYMTAENSGPQGRKSYTHLWEARTCADFETAMRWNRPPNVPGGSFGKQMVYLTDTVPADLPSQSEVFIRGTIEKGDQLVAGGWLWILKMKDGSRVQAAEMQDFITKQDQETAGNSRAMTLDKPSKPGRVLCGQAVFQGMKGKDPSQEDRKIPQFSLLYAIDRDK
jgi:hypothetical protein